MPRWPRLVLTHPRFSGLHAEFSPHEGGLRMETWWDHGTAYDSDTYDFTRADVLKLKGFIQVWLRIDKNDDPSKRGGGTDGE
jgi:hypothetical protein